MQSALYAGTVRHRRHAPVPHAFQYPVCLAWIDLDELDTVFAGRWFWSARRPALAWLRRADYYGDPSRPLADEVRDRVARDTGLRPEGPIRLLTHLRTFGHCFNPVSFYYCYDRSGARVEAVLAEITNTPWNERHAYVLPASASEGRGSALRFRFGKAFHVSPFMPMRLDYDWRFATPGDTLAVHMENLGRDGRMFDATLALRRREITGASLAWALLRFPFATLEVLRAIYWQALKLKLKRVPFFTHPAKLPHSP